VLTLRLVNHTHARLVALPAVSSLLLERFAPYPSTAYPAVHAKDGGGRVPRAHAILSQDHTTSGSTLNPAGSSGSSSSSARALPRSEDELQGGTLERLLLYSTSEFRRFVTLAHNVPMPIPQGPVVSRYTHPSMPAKSRYECSVTGLVVHSNRAVTVFVDEQGDMSMGRLQDPKRSTLQLLSNNDVLATLTKRERVGQNPAMSFSEYDMKRRVVGGLTYFSIWPVDGKERDDPTKTVTEKEEDHSSELREGKKTGAGGKEERSESDEESEDERPVRRSFKKNRAGGIAFKEEWLAEWRACQDGTREGLFFRYGVSEYTRERVVEMGGETSAYVDARIEKEGRA